MINRPFEKIYVKDFDGNILNAPTVYYFEEKQPDGSWKEVEILAHDHDSNPTKYMNQDKYRFMSNDRDSTYQNCRDYGTDPRHPGPLGLIKDIEKALEQQSFAPSFEKFKNEVLVNAELFAIITARANGSDTLKHGMKRINELTLTQDQKEQQVELIKKRFSREKYSDTAALDRYFDINCYVAVNNVETQKFLGLTPSYASHQKKVEAMKWYIGYVADLVMYHEGIEPEEQKLKLGFSDDGFANIHAMADFFASLYDSGYSRSFHDYPYDYLDYRLYYTGNLPKEEFRKNIQNIKDNYPSLSFTEKDQSYKNVNGIWMPVTKISIEKAA